MQRETAAAIAEATGVLAARKRRRRLCFGGSESLDGQRQAAGPREEESMEPPSKRHRQESTPLVLPLASCADDTPGLATGVHKAPKVGAETLERLQSVERGLCSQTLDTPAHLASANAALLCSRADVTGALGLDSGHKKVDLDFTISYSQSYSRLSSMDAGRQDEAGEGAGPSSWDSDTHHYSAKNSPDAEGPHRTPELSAQPGQATPPTRKFFPLFRPKSEWKTIHIIRHGESEYNAATTSKDMGFADPQIYDPKLTTRGRRQACALRPQLEAMKISKDALWVVSPLTRALETMLLGCPHSERIGARENALNVVVHKDVAEQCQTTGDIGLPASVMCEKFPQFRAGMCSLPERWWHRQDANDAELKRFYKPESTKQMRVRVGDFRKWVQSRPEKVIVAFGHNCLFKELTNGQKSLRNCEVHSMAI